MINRIIYFPPSTPPRTPNSALPFAWRYIALVVAYIRNRQAELARRMMAVGQVRS